MAAITVGGVEYPLHPPRQRIVVAEVQRAMGTSQERAFAAALGLAARTLWSAERREPKYRGDPLDYGAEVYELLAAAGWTHTQIVLGGLEAWKAWAALAVRDEEVREAEGFTAPPAAETSA